MVTFVTCNYRNKYQKLQLGSGFKPTNNYYSKPIHFLSPPFEPLPSTGLRRSTGGGRRDPPFPKRDGGGIRRAVVRSPAVTVTRHAQAGPLPLVPVWVPTTDAAALLSAALLFLPPALSLIHPALYLPASIFVLLTAPPSLSSPWRQQHRRPAKRRSHEVTVAGGRQAAGYPVPVVADPAAQGGGGGGRAQNTAPCRSRDCAADQSVGRFLVIVIVVGESVGGSARGDGCRAWRQRRKRQQWQK